MSRELVKKFIVYLQESGKSNSTVIAYAKDLDQLIEIVEIDLNLATAEQLNTAVSSMQAGGKFTPKTISRKINSYRTFYRYLNEINVISGNPAESVKHPKLTSRAPRILAPVEYLALREISRSNTRLYTMIEIMLQTGIRIGELSRLTISDITLDKNKATMFIKAYSSTPARTIVLNAKGTQLLESFLATMPGVTPQAPLFATRDGKSIIIRNIRSAVDRAMHKAGVKEACVNDLRNTFIVAQLQAGVPISLVTESVGHRSKVTTQKYLELLPKKYKANGENKLMDV